MDSILQALTNSGVKDKGGKAVQNAQQILQQLLSSIGSLPAQAQALGQVSPGEMGQSINNYEPGAGLPFPQAEAAGEPPFSPVGYLHPNTPNMTQNEWQQYIGPYNEYSTLDPAERSQMVSQGITPQDWLFAMSSQWPVNPPTTGTNPAVYDPYSSMVNAGDYAGNQFEGGPGRYQRIRLPGDPGYENYQGPPTLNTAAKTNTRMRLSPETKDYFYQHPEDPRRLYLLPAGYRYGETPQPPQMGPDFKNIPSNWVQYYRNNPGYFANVPS